MTFKNMTVTEKIVSVSTIICSLAIVVLAILQIFDVWSDAGFVYLPLMAVNLILQAIREWKKNRSVAIVSICAAFIVTACVAAVTVIELFVR